MINYIDDVTEGFLAVLREDKHMDLQETENSMAAFEIGVTLDQVQVVRMMLKDLLSRIDLSAWDYDNNKQGARELGGDLYIGLMYDSYNTPLWDVDRDWICEVNPWVDDDEPTLARVEGHFTIEDTVYSM